MTKEKRYTTENCFSSFEFSIQLSILSSIALKNFPLFHTLFESSFSSWESFFCTDSLATYSSWQKRKQATFRSSLKGVILLPLCACNIFSSPMWKNLRYLPNLSSRLSSKFVMKKIKPWKIRVAYTSLVILLLK